MGGASFINAYAGGNIVTKSFVKAVSGSPGKFVQAGANDAVVGAVGMNLKYPQGLGGSATLVAESGDSVEVIGPAFTAEVTLGGTVVEGGWVKSDGSGFAVAIATTGTTKQQIAGLCLRGGGNGEIGLILIWPIPTFVALS
jgi:hypothetical protein